MNDGTTGSVYCAEIAPGRRFCFCGMTGSIVWAVSIDIFAGVGLKGSTGSLLRDDMAGEIDSVCLRGCTGNDD